MLSPGSQREAYRSTVGWLAVLLAVALTAVYWNHFDNAFQFDDSHTIVNNASITDIRNLASFFTDALTTSSLPTNQAYRPVVTALNAIDFWLAGGLDPRVFHWHIFIEFLVLLALLYHVLVHIFRLASGARHRLTALAGTAFFAFHTANAETINYIIARSDGFSTLMVLAGLLLFVRNTGWKRQLGLIPLVAGSLAKPTTLMLAPLLAVYALMLERPSLTVTTERSQSIGVLRRATSQTAAYFILGALLFWFTRSMYSDSWLPGGREPWHYLITQAWVIWIYLKTFILPTGLTADTDLGIIRDMLDPRVLWGLAIIAAMLALAWLAARRRETLPIAFGILWFFICLAPSSSVIPLAEVMNHHRTFMPYIGLVMAATWGIALTARRLLGGPLPNAWKAGFALTFALVVAAHAYGTWQRNEVWDSNESLWRDVTIKSPQNGRGLMNYGLALMARGDIEGAISYYERALDTDYARHPYLYVNLGIATSALGTQRSSSQLTEQAEQYFRQAIQLGPGYPQTHYRYAEWLVGAGRRNEALPHLRKALELSPANKGAQQLLEATLGVMQAEAEESEHTAIRKNTPAAWLNASLAWYQAGDYPRSLRAAQAALDLDPGYAPAHNNICAALNELGDFEAAIAACQAALAIDPEFELARANLEWARERIDKDG